MNAIFSRLNGKERRMLERLGVAALLLLAVSLAVGLRERNAYFDAKDSLEATQARRRNDEKSRAAVEEQWRRWQDARRDLESLRGTYFYEEKTIFRSLRLDLQQIFNRTGMDVPQIDYSYSDVDKGQIKKIVVVFDYTGAYADLKKFLAAVESFPKFLSVEKIDFLKPEEDSGVLHLKVTLAAYYEI
jgi:Tfp pilus assembly protein PilO